MLGYTRSHKDYIKFVIDGLRVIAIEHPEQINKYRIAISKMLILNLDPLIPIIKPLYPDGGRMAERQLEIFRSFILMKDLGIPLNNWVDKLTHNPVLRLVAGFNLETMPNTSSYYDFINRLVPLDDRSVIRPVMFKPKEQLKVGEKLPPENPGIVDELVDFIFNDPKRFM